MPFLIITVEAALRSMDGRYEEAAASLGRPAVDHLPAGDPPDDLPVPGGRDRAHLGPSPRASSAPPSPSPETSRDGPRPFRWPCTSPCRRTSTLPWPSPWPSWPSPSWCSCRCGAAGWARSTREPERRGPRCPSAPSRSSSRLEVADGEVLAVLGPNGSGKSTLLRALAGLQPLTGGRIVVDGVVLDDPAAGVLVPPEKRPCGMVFQDYLLFPHLTVLANVAFGPRSRGCPRADANRRARQWLDRMDLADRAGLETRSALRWAGPAGGRGPGPGHRTQASPARRAHGRPRRRRQGIGPPPAPAPPRHVQRLMRHGHPRPPRRGGHRRSAGHRRGRESGAAGNPGGGDQSSAHRVRGRADGGQPAPGRGPGDDAWCSPEA